MSPGPQKVDVDWYKPALTVYVSASLIAPICLLSTVQGQQCRKNVLANESIYGNTEAIHCTKPGDFFTELKQRIDNIIPLKLYPERSNIGS